MAKEVLFLVEDADEGGYVARALGHSIFTEADSWGELRDGHSRCCPVPILST